MNNGMTYLLAMAIVMAAFLAGRWWGASGRGDGQAAAAKGGMLATLQAVELCLDVTGNLDLLKAELARLRKRAEEMSVED